MRSWERPPRLVAYTTEEVHVWRVTLQPTHLDTDAHWTLLSEDERERANRFHFEADRVHYVARRAILRRLLSQYLPISPGDIRFEYGEHGKPHVLHQGKGMGFTFNASHSDEWMLVAIGCGTRLGVDVEKKRMDIDHSGIVSYFSKLEQSEWQALAEVDRLDAFYRCWTRKEAFVKAQGTGLAFGLSNFDVTLRPTDPPAVRHVRSAEPRGWTVHDVDPGGMYAGSVITEHSRRLRTWDWQTLE